MTTKIRVEQTIAANCRVRAAHSGDCNRMAELATQLGYPSSPDDIKRRIAEMTDPGRFVVYVAEDPQHEVIGWIGVYIFRSVEIDKHAEISGLIVDQDARCHGVGARLLLAAEEWARTNGCIHLSVRSNVVRERAHQFYLRHAYEATKTQKTFIKRLDQP